MPTRTTDRNAGRLGTAAVAVSALAGVAMAGPVAIEGVWAPSNAPMLLSSETAPDLGAALERLSGYLPGGGVDNDPIPAAHQNSIQSLSLRMLGAFGATGFVNSLGEVLVQINTGYVSLGTNSVGTQIEGQVRQYFTPDQRNFIEATIRSNNGAPLVPIGTTVGGQTAVAFGWEVGRTDPIDWQQLWTQVNVPANGAIATLIGPGGVTVPINHTPELVGPNGGPWNGSDPDNLLISLGDLFHTVRVTYEVQPIPAPAGLAVLGLALGVSSRRRR